MRSDVPEQIFPEREPFPAGRATEKTSLGARFHSLLPSCAVPSRLPSRAFGPPVVTRAVHAAPQTFSRVVSIRERSQEGVRWRTPAVVSAETVPMKLRRLPAVFGLDRDASRWQPAHVGLLVFLFHPGWLWLLLLNEERLWTLLPQTGDPALWPKTTVFLLSRRLLGVCRTQETQIEFRLREIR